MKPLNLVYNDSDMKNITIISPSQSLNEQGALEIKNEHGNYK